MFESRMSLRKNLQDTNITFDTITCPSKILNNELKARLKVNTNICQGIKIETVASTHWMLTTKLVGIYTRSYQACPSNSLHQFNIFAEM